MAESENLEEDTISFQEIYDYETRNLAGCDNDDSCCTFPKGYAYRQALYHCLTCREISGKQAGICFPCSVHCHAGHVLEDLYTKRNFRCDCGNSNFPDNFKCQLWEEKDDINIKNKYNHNFSGLYCVCNSEYDESKDTEEMIQCVICEDWYHLKHLAASGSDSQPLEHFEEFVCKLCLERCEYLALYNRASVNKVLGKYIAADGNCNLEAARAALEQLGNNCEEPGSLSGNNGGAFWPSDWRESLCRCASCQQLMKRDETGFLHNANDTIAYYYTNDQEKFNDEFKEQMSTMPHAVAIKLADGIAYFKRELIEFLNNGGPDKVVTTEDVHNFFDKIKRRRLEKFE